MSIEYITDVKQDKTTTFVVSINGKSVNVEFTAEHKSSYNDHIHQSTYKYNQVTINDDMTVYASNAYLAEIVLAVEIVRVIKEELNQGGSK